MAETYDLDPDHRPAGKVSPKSSASQPSGRTKKHRNWTWLDDDQQKRFLAAQKKKGLEGSALLSMIFNEWADKEGL